MKYAWINEGNNSGPVAGLNRGAFEGELEGTVSPQELTEGIDHRLYKVENGNIRVQTNSFKLQLAKDEAYAEMIESINQLNREKNLENFLYAKPGTEEEPNPEYNYVADKESIQGTQNSITGCLATDCVPSDPIPTPNGVWKTDDVEEDGFTPVYVPYTMEEFLKFAEAFYVRSSENFGVKEFHKGNVRALYLDNSKLAEDILGYDITQGWK